MVVNSFRDIISTDDGGRGEKVSWAINENEARVVIEIRSGRVVYSHICFSG